MEIKTYESLKQCSSAENIPVTVLSAAKNLLKAPGFRGSRVDWHILKPWIDENQEAIDDVNNQTLQEVKTQNAIKDGILKDLMIAEKRGEAINPKEVVAFLQGIGKALSAIHNRSEKDISSKVDSGTAKLISNCFAETRKAYKTGLAEWMDKQKLNS